MGALPYKLTMSPRRVAADFETYLITPGNQAPPPVCGSFHADDGTTALYSAEEALDAFAALIAEGSEVEGANIAYDNGVAAAARPEFVDRIFAAYEAGLFFDVQIAMALDQVANGTLAKDPTTGGMLRTPPKLLPDGTQKAGKVTTRYSLETIIWLLFGRPDAKANDEFRLRYGQLAAKPMAEWPELARVYPLDDVRNTREAAIVLRAQGKNLGPVFRFIPGVTYEASHQYGWDHQTHQARSAWAMHLLSTWGLRTDPVAVAELEKNVNEDHAEAVKTFKDSGLLKWDTAEQTWKENGTALKQRVVVAYGGDLNVKCLECSGTGKVPSSKTKKPINCKKCSATGLDIPKTVPRTDGDGVSAARDALEESGDDLLTEYAKSTESDKLRETYVPWLWQGTKYPINVRPNVLLATGRASMEGLLQLVPRKGGARECFVPRPEHLFCSTDYGAQEFVTLGQVVKWTTGSTRIADTMNSGLDPHVVLGGRMLSTTYEAFAAELLGARKAFFKDIRQGTKAGNFGFGGLMGPVKFARTQKKAKIGEHGSMCRLMGREEQPCGQVKVTEWNRREYPPTCRQCIEVSAELKAGWLDTWETQEYFDWIAQIPGIEDGHGVIVSPGSGYVRGGLNASEAANHCFQHLASMSSKHALWLIAKACFTDRKSPLFGQRIVAFTHDEVFTELHRDVAHEAAIEQARLMRVASDLFCPDVRVKCEPALMDRWYKAAEPAFDSNGKLIPWSPTAVYDKKGVYVGEKKSA